LSTRFPTGDNHGIRPLQTKYQKKETRLH